ncbi:MAG: iron-containing alcohol dehydrogenase [Actinobacteria bacterium]|nr:iron-containing alcohol dehydrogenase [Actinomycetota bacterium]
MIVRWGIEELEGMLEKLDARVPVLVTSSRWAGLDLPVARRFEGVRPHVPVATVAAALTAAEGADSVVGLGGGSAIDTAKAVSARLGLPLVSIPTTYAGAEWTPYFGMRDEERGVKSGGAGARLAGIVYEPKLTLDLPREETVGTAMNALAHCAEALYVEGRNEEADRHALAGASLIDRHLPEVLESLRDLPPRTGLLEGAAEAGAALAGAGLALGHAMAQALGGRYGLPHGALNAICLPAALRFNEGVAAQTIARFGAAMGTEHPIERVEELAGLGGFRRLRELGVPSDELDEVGEATAERSGAKANPRRAAPAEIAALLRSVW